MGRFQNSRVLSAIRSYFSRNVNRRKRIIVTIFSGLILIFVVFFRLPDPVFSDPCSTVVFDRDGELLGARISDDGQWRFPQPDSVPEKYKQSLIFYEDKYFYYHPGFNPVALLRALYLDVKAGEIVSGGSTISMQVIRLSRKGKPRTVREKIIEIILALKLEIKYSKEEILNLYAGHAPFGGNVVGIESASWRYFGRDPGSLSRADAATLAVLPNAPSLMHPGKNRNLLLEKRNRLLRNLLEREIIDSTEYQLSLLEEIPEVPRNLPNLAFHLTDRFFIHKRGQRIQTTIDSDLQSKANKVVSLNKTRLSGMQIRNAACLIIDVNSGEVLSYIGNIRNPGHPEYGGDVDVVMAERSTGSILKPFLYSFMQYRGVILPNTLIADIPTRYGAYSPKNFNRDYEGVVKASHALSKSLNIPAVRMLQDYGMGRFHDDLKSLGLSSFNKQTSYYGLSLILGGAEVSLWELGGAYASMARTLNHFNESEGKYFKEDWHSPVIEKTAGSYSNPMSAEQGRLGAGAIWLCFEALRDVNRPIQETGWNLFSSSRKVAWKTGTSFGFRDGWAVAVTPEYVVAVWTGNADGEGMPGLTGLNAAGPFLFDLLNMLPKTHWFDIPYDDLVRIPVCSKSGYRPGKNCENTDTIRVSRAGLKSGVCPYHRLIHLDGEGRYRVNTDCYPADKIVHKKWFVLPPAEEWFYQRKDPGYQPLPDVMKGCRMDDNIKQIQIIYPEQGAVIYVPNELDGSKGKVVFEAAHRKGVSKIFWHLDDSYLATTTRFHQLSLQPGKGKHRLTLVDEKGNSEKVRFEIIDKH